MIAIISVVIPILIVVGIVINCAYVAYGGMEYEYDEWAYRLSNMIVKDIFIMIFVPISIAFYLYTYTRMALEDDRKTKLSRFLNKPLSNKKGE